MNMKRDNNETKKCKPHDSNSNSKKEKWYDSPPRWVPKSIVNIFMNNDQRKYLKEKHDTLQKEIVGVLCSKEDADVSDKLAELGNLEQILESENEWPSRIRNLFLFTILSVLILMNIPGCVTPGFIDVKTKHVDFVVASDYEWAGTTNLQEKKAILLSNFEQIYSPNIPELLLSEPEQILSVNTNLEAVLGSIFIPVGTRVKVDWDKLEQIISFEFLPAKDAFTENSQLRVEYLLSGETIFESETLVGTSKEVRSAVPCDFYDGCIESRSLIASSPIASKPRISFGIKDEIDLYGFEVEHFLFSKYTTQNSQRRRKRCMIISGEYWLRGDATPSVLRRGECTQIVSDEGSLSIQLEALPKIQQGLDVWYQGNIAQIYVGTPEFATNKSPQIFMWALSHPNIKIIISFISAILAAGLVIIRIRK